MQTLSEKLQALLDEAVSTGEIGCGSVLISRCGDELAYAQSGMADPRTHTPIARDTIFRLYSQSKPVTAAAAMILMERGKIDLLSPVRRWLPGFKACRVQTGSGATVPAHRDVRVIDLLSMTSGLCYPGEDDDAGRAAAALFDENTRLMAEGKGMDTLTFCSRMGELPLAFQPGERFGYGTSADVLGAVVEAASGMRFGEFLRRELFEPLGMKDTGFYVPPEKMGRLAASTWRREGQPNTLWTKPHLCCGVTSEPPAFESGGAGLYSTLDDFERFGHMLLNMGELDGVRVLSPRTVEWMTSPQLNVQEARLRDSWPYMDGFGYGKLMRVCL